MKVVEIKHFLDKFDNVSTWPAKKSQKLLVLAYLSNFFEKEKLYSEAEINQILKDHHTFSDWPLLRRELVESGFLSRDKNGYQYWRIK